MSTLPSEKDIAEFRPDIIVVDDLTYELGSNAALLKWFTKKSHHLNISIIFIVQILFFGGKFMRNISLNSQYIILLKNARDKRQIISLGSQIYPRNLSYFLDAYDKATNKPFGYLLIDLSTNTPDELRLRTNIVPVNGRLTPIVYHVKTP